MLSARSIRRTFNLLKPGGTSRGLLYLKDSWFLVINATDDPGHFGIGECSLIPGLSADPLPEFENELSSLCQNINKIQTWVEARGNVFPAIRFGLEMALADLENGRNRLFGETEFTRGKAGIDIHGLIWMGDSEALKKQIREKIEKGFRCLKMKVGAMDFHSELEILRWIRKEYPDKELEIRLDANGAFRAGEALGKLKLLSDFNLHSLEQPIKAGQAEQMAELCEKSPVPIALDEELIGLNPQDRENRVRFLRPAFLVLKPSLLGGFELTSQLIELSSKLEIDWIINSSLESNLGLNAIAQFTAQQQPTMVQGLGTGKLFVENFDGPLNVANDKLFYNPYKEWNLKLILP